MTRVDRSPDRKDIRRRLGVDQGRSCCDACLCSTARTPMLSSGGNRQDIPLAPGNFEAVHCSAGPARCATRARFLRAWGYRNEGRRWLNRAMAARHRAGLPSRRSTQSPVSSPGRAKPRAHWSSARCSARANDPSVALTLDDDGIVGFVDHSGELCGVVGMYGRGDGLPGC